MTVIEATVSGRDSDGQRAIALSARQVVKKYGDTTVLRGVSLDVHAGEVLGLIGANGAGKSTLVSIIGGSVPLTSGSISVPDAPSSGPAVETVHQDVDAALVPELSIAENLVLPRLAAGELGRAPSGRRIRESAHAIANGRLDDLDLSAPVSTLGTSAKQRVLIARALSRRPTVLILDEPTAALSVTEQRELRASVRELAAAGTAVVFITHHLGEIAATCDRVVALRDGQVTAEFAAPFDEAQLALAILGELANARRVDGSAQSDSDDRPARTAAAGPERRSAQREGAASDAPAVLELRGVRAFAHSAPVELSVRRGEIVGITGLLGAGKTELIEQIVGATPLRHGGRLLVDGAPYAPRHPRDAVAAGLGFVPENRVTEAEIPEWTIAESITLPDLLRYRRGGLLSGRAERQAAASIIERLGIVTSGPRAAIETLSGGNRQKVVVGRWIAARSRVLVLDEPFRGVDIGARADIARLLRDGHIAGDVDAVLVASSDPEEILEVADRILVMAGGAIVGEVSPAEVDADSLSDLMTRTAASADAETRTDTTRTATTTETDAA